VLVYIWGLDEHAAHPGFQDRPASGKRRGIIPARSRRRRWEVLEIAAVYSETPRIIMTEAGSIQAGMSKLNHT
jgi:hypothetical protein